MIDYCDEHGSTHLILSLQDRSADTMLSSARGQVEMTKQEFLDAALREKICPRAFSLDGHEKNECYVLSDDNGYWSVYYGERGLERGRQYFSSEEAALEHLLARLKSDLTTRPRA